MPFIDLQQLKTRPSLSAGKGMFPLNILVILWRAISFLANSFITPKHFSCRACRFSHIKMTFILSKYLRVYTDLVVSIPPVIHERCEITYPLLNNSFSLAIIEIFLARSAKNTQKHFQVLFELCELWSIPRLFQRHY